MKIFFYSLSCALFLFFLCNPFAAQGQTPPRPREKKSTQLVRGRIVDKYSRQPVVGALISVDNVYPFLSAYSNDNGVFSIERVPIGRQSFSVECKGYSRLEERDVMISTGKEIFIEFEITDGSQALLGRPRNEMLLVSSRSFSVEEVQRFPVTFNDPNRTAMSFAGVQPIRDGDSDVNTRGNSSMTALWRLEGLDIPNPNHFAFMAVMGGGLTVFSTSLMDNMDWSIGAWSADYGNSIVSATDLKFRKGNLFKREHNFQAGLLGLNLATEGPIKKERSSYLINYRYSTLGVLSQMGIYLVRDNVSNNFQDLSFNTHFSSRNNKTTANVFGVLGISDENWFIKKDTSEWLVDLDYIRNKNGSNLAILGSNINHTINENSYLNIVTGITASKMYFNRWKPTSKELLSGTVIDSHFYRNIAGSVAVTYNTKINERFLLKTGFIAKQMFYELQFGKALDSNGVYTPLINEKLGQTQLFQGFAQSSYRPSKKLTINTGIHSLFFTLNSTYSVEPRLALRYQFNERNHIKLAYGLHGAILPLGAYFVQLKNEAGEIYKPNLGLKMLQSHHFVAAFNHILDRNTYLRAEAFLQRIQNAPISPDSNSVFWYFNTRDTQGDGRYISEGQGRNYGLNLTLERKFSQGYYAVIAANITHSDYKTLDKIWRPTQNDAHIFGVITGGRELNLGRNNSLQLNARVFVGDGIRYIPADTMATMAQDKLVLNYAAGWAGKPFYFRTDLRVAYRKNNKKTSFVASVDIQNATNQKNMRDVLYNQREKLIYKRYHSGLTPNVNFQFFF